MKSLSKSIRMFYQLRVKKYIVDKKNDLHKYLAYTGREESSDRT